MRQQWSLPILHVLWSLTFPTHPASAYPNWMKCYIPLENTERVMGTDILAFEDTRYKLYIEVQDPDTLQWSHVSDFEYTGPTSVKARLKVPPKMQDSTIMFVMESTEGAKLDPPMCKGKRSFARDGDAEITVKIDGTQDRIELWAGWARGFEPVKLTKRIILWKKGIEKGSYDELEEEDLGTIEFDDDDDDYDAEDSDDEEDDEDDDEDDDDIRVDDDDDEDDGEEPEL